jgi:phosphatidylethanolamine/phosphatidyl-N-methylethanolamine N-methyltransferase
MSHYAEFLQGLLLAPRAVSAPTPSGPVLAATMAAEADLSRRGLIVELGPGSGTVTEALIARGMPLSRLVAVECTPYFARLLQHRYPAARIIEGDAFAFERYLPQHAEVAAVISGVPLLNFPPSSRARLITRSLEMCGRFIQLSYGWVPPIPPLPGARLTKKIVWRNFPPAHVWTYSS